MSDTARTPTQPPAASPDGIDDARVHDALSDAATTLAGIADALAYRTAVYADDMLELIADAAESRATALHELIGHE